MTELELKILRTNLYKATPLKLQLVDELTTALKKCFGDMVEVNQITFKSNQLKMDDGLFVKMIEIDPQQIGAVLIHWYPQFDKSTTSDPFCSAYMLTPNEIRKIIKMLQLAKDFYLKHSIT